MLRAICCALIACAVFLPVPGVFAGDWTYRAYEQDEVRWHTLALEDQGYRLAFFCHGASDGIKVTLRTPDPLFMPTAFAAANRDQLTEGLHIANREVIAGPYPVVVAVDENSSYELEFYHVTFYGVIARNDSSYTITDLLNHLGTARSLALMRVGDDAIGPDRPLAVFDLTATEGAFNRLYDLCGGPPVLDRAPISSTGPSASR